MQSDKEKSDQTDSLSMYSYITDDSYLQSINKEDFHGITLDLRSKAEYDRGHIKESISCYNFDIFKDIYKEIILEDFLVFVYCDDGKELSKEMCKKIKNYDREGNEGKKDLIKNVMILMGGYSSFYSKHPTKCSQTGLHINDRSSKKTKRIFKEVIKEGDKSIFFSFSGKLTNEAPSVDIIINFSDYAKADVPCKAVMQFYNLQLEERATIASEDYFLFRVCLGMEINGKNQIYNTKIYKLHLGETADLPVMNVGDIVIVELLPYMPKETSGVTSFLKALVCCFLPILPPLRSYDRRYPLISWLRDYQINGKADWTELVTWFQTDFNLNLKGYQLKRDTFSCDFIRETDKEHLSDFAKSFFERFLLETGLTGNYILDSPKITTTEECDVLFYDQMLGKDIGYNGVIIINNYLYEIVSCLQSSCGHFNSFVSTPNLPALDNVYKIDDSMKLLESNLIDYTFTQRPYEKNQHTKYPFGNQTIFTIFVKGSLYNKISTFQPIHPFYSISEHPVVYEEVNCNIVKVDKLKKNCLYFPYDREKGIFSALPLQGPYGDSILQIPLESVNKNSLKKRFQCVMVKYGDNLFPLIVNECNIKEIFLKAADSIPFIKNLRKLIENREYESKEIIVDGYQFLKENEMFGGISNFYQNSTGILPFKSSAKTFLDDFLDFSVKKNTDSLKKMEFYKLVNLLLNVDVSSEYTAGRYLEMSIEEWAINEFKLCRTVSNRITKIYSSRFEMPTDGLIIIKATNYAKKSSQLLKVLQPLFAITTILTGPNLILNPIGKSKKTSRLVITNFVDRVVEDYSGKQYFNTKQTPSLWKVPKTCERKCLFIKNISEESKTELEEEEQIHAKESDISEKAIFADIVNNNRNCFMPLNAAAATGELEVVKYLIETCGKDPDEEDEFEQTPLMFASCSGNLEIVKYLVEKCNCNIKKTNVFGWTPISIAEEGKNKDVVEFLQNKLKEAR